MAHRKVYKWCWCWSRYGKERRIWLYCLQYWAIYSISRIRVQVLCRKPLIILSGFMSQGRGLHWDRKSRYGEK